MELQDMKKASRPLIKSKATEGELPTQEQIQYQSIILAGAECVQFARIEYRPFTYLRIRREGEREKKERERAREKGRDR